MPSNKKEYNQQYYERNKERIYKQHREYVERNKERLRAKRSEYFQRHKGLGWYRDKKLAEQRRRRGVHGVGGERRYGACPLCLENKSLVADHDHKTGMFRGWICNNCNLQVGIYEKLHASEKHQKYLKSKE